MKSGSPVPLGMGELLRSDWRGKMGNLPPSGLASPGPSPIRAMPEQGRLFS